MRLENQLINCFIIIIFFFLIVKCVPRHSIEQTQQASFSVCVAEPCLTWQPLEKLSYVTITLNTMELYITAPCRRRTRCGIEAGTASGMNSTVGTRRVLWQRMNSTVGTRRVLWQFMNSTVGTRRVLWQRMNSTVGTRRVLWERGVCCGNVACAVGTRRVLWERGVCCGNAACAVGTRRVLWERGVCYGNAACAVGTRRVAYSHFNKLIWNK